KVLERRELTLDPVEPRAVGRCQVDSDIVALGPCLYRCHDVRAIVVHHQVQRLRPRITRPNPPQKREKDLAGLTLGETAIEAIGFQVIVGQEVTDIFAAVIVGRDALDMLARSFAAMAMTWQQMQRAKLVDAQTPAAGGPVPIQTAKGPVFPDTQRVAGFLPSLGP